MKKLLLTFAVLVFVAGSAAVASYNGSGSDDDMHIMAGPGGELSSENITKNATPPVDKARASQSGGSSSGDGWKMDIRQKNATCSTGTTAAEVSDVEYLREGGNYTVSFEGSIKGSNPCEKVSATDIIREDDRYVINITTLEGEGFCAQCMAQLDYEAEFSFSEPVDVEVRHEGEEMRTLTHPDVDQENGNDGNQSDSSSEEKGGISRMVRSFLGFLF